MTKSLASQERTQSLGEEIANSISHGVGFLAAVAASPVLVFYAVQRDSAAGIVGASIFAFTMVIMYITSTLYHTLAKNKGKRVFQILDHGAIFLMIAGTYTPFTLGVLRGTWGWTLFGLVWGIAVVGVVLKSVGGCKIPKALNDFISDHGLAHHNCREAFVAQYAIVGPVLVAGRWGGLHCGGGVLRSQTGSVCALRLALVRYRGYCMSLHRCAEIRGLTRLIQPTLKAARLISDVGRMMKYHGAVN
jgi:hypothetical protein